MKLVNDNIKFIKQNSYALLNEKSNFYTKFFIMHVIFLGVLCVKMMALSWLSWFVAITSLLLN